MGDPWNIRNSASQLFYQDKNSAQYAALLEISTLPHPDRSILASFVNIAFDPEEAARHFLRMVLVENSSDSIDNIQQFLSQWMALMEKFRPVEATDLPEETNSITDMDITFSHIISPSVFADPDLADGTPLCEILEAFIGKASLAQFRSFPTLPSTKQHGNIFLLSREAFAGFKIAGLYFKAQYMEKDEDTTLKQCVIGRILSPKRSNLSYLSESRLLENRVPQQSVIVSEFLLGINQRFSEALSWIEIKKYINTQLDYPDNFISRYFSSCLTTILGPFRKLWIFLPATIRAFAYDKLIWAGLRLYGPTISMDVYRLPFNLYLRRGSPIFADNHIAEEHTLSMVRRFTSIPAPRALDIVKTTQYSYFLMTRVPGRPIGQSLNFMTDEQINQAVQDLKQYISELRRIPKPTTMEFQICNSRGEGILDWRIPDSQREKLRFKTEAEFNKYLTDPFWDDIRRQAAVSHDIQHDIVFTHGDLNPRNILAENGKISGIIDWENAGWFPEYWEFTKSHYTVRSVIRWLADVVDRVFEGYRDELVVDNMLSDLFGPF
ncbi:hypothetical protein LOZ53_004576 [Ophidiomyces ophidiicola]|nr:hypothetical protein LOZ53_004576 [Ophidiomyces ophidiicola]KAI1988498.1 hypothetical protein LOZ54_003180 [Ophidiomyces ophidiicola]